MNHQLTPADIAKAEVARARGRGWFNATWRHLEQPKPTNSGPKGAPERDRVLIAIAQGCKTRSDIIETIGKSKRAVGGQCKKLLHLGLICAVPVGQVHHYRLTDAGRKAARELGE